MSLAYARLDFQDDPTILREMKDIPDFVRQTRLAPSTELKKQASSSFALVLMMPDGSVSQKFDIGSPGATWLSVRAFEKNAHKLPVSMQETAAWYLHQACKEWRVKAATDDRLEKIAMQTLPPASNIVTVAPGEQHGEAYETVKTATARFESSLGGLGDDWFAIITTDASGHSRRNYPLHTPNLVKKASAWFDEHFQTLRPDFRKMFSDNLVRAATKHGLVLESQHAFKYAGDKLSSNFGVALDVRRELIPELRNRRVLDELLEKSASLSPLECAKVLELADRKLGIDKHWDSIIPDPYTSVFAMDKIADYSYGSEDGEVSGKKLREFVRGKDYRERLEAYLDKTIIDELERNPIEVFDSLPKPEKRLVMDLMKER